MEGGNMSSNFEAKKVVVSEIKEKFDTAKSAVLVYYRGLTVEELTELRAKFRDAGVDYKVYKNNLVKLAIKDTPYEALDGDMTGPNGIAFGMEDATAPARIIKEFGKKHKNLEMRTGVVEGTYYDVNKIMEIADIPSKDVLIGKFMGSIKAPISNFAYLLTNIIKEKESAEA